MKYSPLHRSSALLLILLVLSACLMQHHSFAKQKIDDPRKVLRKRKRGESNYEHFNYVKTVKHYKKVLKFNPEDDQAILRIADSYRKMGKIQEAREWYGKGEDRGIITEKEDIINYAHVLSALGEYEHSKKWYEEHGMEGERGDIVAAKVKALNNMDQFFEDTTAYFIENVPFNSEFSDFGPSYGHGGVVFSSARAGTGIFKPKYNWDGSSFLELYYVTGHHGTIKEIEGGINTRYHEGPAAFYANDTRVIFTRNNYNKGVAGESDEGVNTLHLFSAERENKDEDWENVKRLWFNTDHHSYGHPTITEDGNTMYFASDMPSSLGGSDIYKSDFVDGRWSTPENMGDVVNTEGNEFFPFIHEEGLLYYASDGLHGIGGLDIYHVDLRDPKTKPQNMGSPINTSLDDFGLIVDSLGLTGYLSSNRVGGVGHDDIYYFEKSEYDIKVVLVDAVTDQPISGQLTSKFQDVWGKEQNLESSQELSYQIIKGRHMMLAGDSEGYQPMDTVVTALLLDSTQLFMEVHVPLIKNKSIVKDVIVVVNNSLQTQVFVKTDDDRLEEYQSSLEALRKSFEEENVVLGEVFTYENIYYDFDKSFIRSDASDKLNEIVSLLNQYPDLKIELASHTDIRGSHEYNRGLARRRVKAARKYLINADISKDRITTGSFGEEKVHVDCESNCDEIKHQSNRRTEIRLFY